MCPNKKLFKASGPIPPLLFRRAHIILKDIMWCASSIYLVEVCILLFLYFPASSSLNQVTEWRIQLSMLFFSSLSSLYQLYYACVFFVVVLVIYFSFPFFSVLIFCPLLLPFYLLFSYSLYPQLTILISSPSTGILTYLALYQTMHFPSDTQYRCIFNELEVQVLPYYLKLSLQTSCWLQTYSSHSIFM